MSSHPPFRFAVTTAGIPNRKRWRRAVRQTEELGYSALLFSDHLSNPLSPLPALAVAATITNTLRLGNLVLDNDFRHPVFLAKELATLDVLSDGRMEWGLGAGWFPPDYEKSGLTFDEARVRVDRLIESVDVIEGLFGKDSFDFTGKHFRVTDLDGRPKPIQPRPPLLIGATQPRLLAYAGRRADIVGVGPSLTTQALFGKPPRETPSESMDRQIDIVRSAAGDRWDKLEVNVTVMPAVVTDDVVATSEELAGTFGLSPESLRESPHALIGSVDEICDVLVERRERWGHNYFSWGIGVSEAMAPVVERLAGK